MIQILVTAVCDRSAIFVVHAVGDLIVQIPVFQQETVINGLFFFQIFQTCDLVISILVLLLGIILLVEKLRLFYGSIRVVGRYAVITVFLCNFNCLCLQRISTGAVCLNGFLVALSCGNGCAYSEVGAGCQLFLGFLNFAVSECFCGIKGIGSVRILSSFTFECTDQIFIGIVDFFAFC